MIARVIFCILSLQITEISAADPPFAANEKILEIAKDFKGRGVQADDTPPSSPLDALEKFTLRPGLAIELIASEPSITQPIHVSWDSCGRLWVVQYRQYPFPAGIKIISYDQHLRAQFDKVPLPPPVGEKGADIISVLEDTNGDGRYDKQFDVLKGLNIVTASITGAGHLWVLNPPYLLSYRLKDGLPIGDPKVELSGFGIEDTHSTATNLQFNIDGWLYGANGSTTTGNVGIPGGKRTSWSGQCIWRFHPVQKIFEIYAEGGGNTYSLDIDSKGRIFSGTNYGDTRGMHFELGSYGVKNWGKHGPLTNPYAYGWFEHMPSTGDKRRFPQAFVIYEGGLLSGEFEGKVLAPNSLANKAYVSQLKPYGSTFRTVDEEDLLSSSDRWFRPVWIGVGPDGCAYIADWYDTRLSHINPVDDWDKQRGRLYRIHPKNKASSLKSFDLSKADFSQLLKLLSHPNEWFRKQAVLEIGWRKLYKAVPELQLMLHGPNALEALWALDLLGAIEEPPVAHSDPYVRRWSWKILGERRSAPNSVQLARAKQETHPEVRAQILASAKRMPVEALPLLNVALGEIDESGHIPLLAWWALEAHLGSKVERANAIAFLRSSPDIVRSTMFNEHLAQRIGRRLAADKTDGLSDVAEVLSLCVSDGATNLLTGVLSELEPGDLPPMPDSLHSALVGLLEKSGSKPISLSKLRAGDQRTLSDALKELSSKSTSARRRNEVAEALSIAGRTEAIDPIIKLLLATHIDPKFPLFKALARYDDKRIAGVIVDNYERSFASSDTLRMFALHTLANKPASALLLIKGVENGKIPAPHINADVARSLLKHNIAEVNATVQRLWKQTLTTGLTPEKDREVERLRRIVRSGNGDAEKGREIFQSRCSNCHILKGEGSQVGPDLTAYDRSSLDFWLLNIIYPSLEIREGFGSYEVRFKDGIVATGILERRDGNEIILRDLAGIRTQIKESKISALNASPTSVMPEGLLAGLSNQELCDLFAYLMH